LRLPVQGGARFRHQQSKSPRGLHEVQKGVAGSFRSFACKRTKGQQFVAFDAVGKMLGAAITCAR
jgi:hypothetical protein